MDNTDPVVPQFNGELKQSADALTDFFLISDAADVPVTKIIIVADGKKHKFRVEPGRYREALFLLYCAVLKQKPSFVFDADLKAMLKPYFGNGIVAGAALFETVYKVLQPIVQGKDVEVNLVLKPGHVLPQGPGRTVRRLIEHGWNEHERGSYRPDTSAPLVRTAVRAFREADRSGKILVIHSWSPQVWPSEKWQDRVRLLALALGMGRSA